MFILQLNDMRSPKVEMVSTIVRAETKEEIEDLIERETVDTYEDQAYQKFFKKGGPLEWCNEPGVLHLHIIDVGTPDIWSENARKGFQDQIMVIPVIPK